MEGTLPCNAPEVVQVVVIEPTHEYSEKPYFEEVNFEFI
jgi:hypothetical protein